MTPHAIAEIPLREVKLEHPITLPPRRAMSAQHSAHECGRAREGTFLSGALLESHRVKSLSRARDLLVALTVHAPSLPY